MTKRRITVYRVRILLDNVKAIWKTEEERQRLAHYFYGQASFEEERRVLAKHIREEESAMASPPYARIFIEGPAGWLEEQRRMNSDAEVPIP